MLTNKTWKGIWIKSYYMLRVLFFFPPLLESAGNIILMWFFASTKHSELGLKTLHVEYFVLAFLVRDIAV